MPDHDPDAVHDVALALDQDNTVVSPATISYGFADKVTVGVLVFPPPVDQPPDTLPDTRAPATSVPPPPPPQAVMMASKGTIIICR